MVISDSFSFVPKNQSFEFSQINVRKIPHLWVVKKTLCAMKLMTTSMCAKFESNIPIKSGGRSAERSSFLNNGQRSSFLNNGQIWVRVACRPAGRLWRRFWNLISTRLCVWFTWVLHRVVGLFKRSCLQPELAHLGVTLASNACRVTGLQIVR